MPKRASLPYSVGRIFPRPVRLALAGRSLRVVELRIRDLAAIEQGAARHFGHPRLGIVPLEEAFRAAQAMERTPEKRRIVRRAGDALSAAASGWPPRFGSGRFGEYLMSPAGAFLHLRLALRPERGKLSRAAMIEVGTAMTPREWESVDRVTFGMADWECGRPLPADPAAAIDEAIRRGNGTGMKWGEAIRHVMKTYAMTMADVGGLYVSQLDFLVSDDPSRECWITDCDPAP